MTIDICTDRVRIAATVAASPAMAACSSSRSDPVEELVAEPDKGPVDSLRWNLTVGELDTLEPPDAVTYSGGQVVTNLSDSLLRFDANLNMLAGLAEYEQVSPTELSKADEKFNTEISGVIYEKAQAEKVGYTFGAAAGGLRRSGPFELEKCKTGDSITIARSDDYWDQERPPLAGEVKSTFLTDSACLTQALHAGEIDGAYEIPPSAIPAVTSFAYWMTPNMAQLGSAK